jgi:hypothetical protein
MSESLGEIKVYAYPEDNNQTELVTTVNGLNDAIENASTVSDIFGALAEFGEYVLGGKRSLIK